MRTKEYRQIKKEVDKFLEKFDEEALKEGVPSVSKEYRELRGEIKSKMLEEAGVDVEDYLREEISEGAYDEMGKVVEKVEHTAKKAVSDLYIAGREQEAEDEIEERQERSRNERAESILESFTGKLKNLPKK